MKGWDILVDTKFLNSNQIEELINRRRRQILVHSVIYYKLNENLIDDNTWSKWATELEELQSAYPDIADKCVLTPAFADFDHSTGMSLPLDDSWAVNTARWLLNNSRRIQRPL